MAKIDYYTIHRWMREDLHLEDTELECYAVIYSLSQGDNWFVAGVKNIMEVLGKSKPTIVNVLKSLTQKGLIVKVPVVVNKIKRNYYKATKTVDESGLNELTSGGLNDLTNGGLNDLTSYILKENNKEVKDKEKENMLSNDNNKSDALFDLFWKKYKKGSKKAAIKAWNKLKDKQKELALKNIDAYLVFCKRSGRSIKDVSTYLNGECFNDDWSAIPDCYQVNDLDDDRTKRFKRYMVSKFPDLIYHRNPLTYEQCDELFDEYGVGPFEEAMKRLCGRDIHQYYSIKSGVEHVLKEVQDDNI